MSHNQEHDVDEVLKRQAQLAGRRSNFDSYWQNVAEYMWPDAADFTSQRSPGVRRDRKIFDSTATGDLEKFAAVMEFMLTPRQQVWHGIKSTNEDLNKEKEAKEWFAEVVRAMFRARDEPDSLYYSQKHEGYKSLGAFGNDCLFMDEPRDGIGVRFKNCHVGQVWIETNHQGKVDTVYRKYSLSAKAVEKKWPNNVPEKVANALKLDPWKPFEFLHVVTPRENPDLERLDAAGMAWLSLEIAIDDKMIVEESGYREMPYLYSRYTVNSTEMYGRGQGMMVLPHVLSVNEMQKTFLRAGQKVVDPPLLAADDGVIGAGSQRVGLRPGYVNYGAVNAQGQPLIRPLETGANLPLSLEMIETERAVIHEAFFVPLYMFLKENPQMTATQVLAMVQEKAELRAPLIGRQQSEMLGPEIDRLWRILERQGRIPPMPGVLLEAEGEYKIVYESPAMNEQRMNEFVGIQRTIDSVAPFAAVDPGVYDVFKVDEIARLSGEINGAPVSIFRTEEEMEALTERREQEAKQQQALDQAQQGAAAAKDASAAGLIPQQGNA